MMSVLSPLNLVGLIVAMLLDIFGLLCLFFDYIFGPFIGEALSLISDFAGAIFFSFWSLVQSGGLVTKKSAKKRIMKLIVTFFGETLPFLGALPFWTIFIITEILSKQKK